MHKFFCFLSCFAGLAVSSSAYGNWPNPKDFLKHLLGGTSGLYATFKAAFEDVYRDAEPSDFKNLKLFGEGISTLESRGWFRLQKYDHEVLQRNQGFFSCMVALRNVLNIKDVEEAVKKKFEDIEKAVKGKFSKDSIDNKLMPAVTKICKVLLSEDFARKLLTESFVDEFLASAKDYSDYSYCSVCFSDYSYCSVCFCPVWYSECDFSFRLQYVQPLSQVRLEFEVDFNVQDCCLGENGEVDIGNNFEIQGCFIHSKKGCLSEDDLVAAKKKLEVGTLDKGTLIVNNEEVHHMKAIRMMTKDANMGDKKLTGNPQTDQEAHNTQHLPAPNPHPTVNNGTGKDERRKDFGSFSTSEFPNTEVREI